MRYPFLNDSYALTSSNGSLGVIDASTVVQAVKEVSAGEKRRQELLAARPPIDNVLNLHDFEVRRFLDKNPTPTA